MKNLLQWLLASTLFIQCHLLWATPAVSCPPTSQIKDIIFKTAYFVNARWEFTSPRFESNHKIWLLHYSTLLYNKSPIADTKQALLLGNAQFKRVALLDPPEVRHPENITCVYADKLHDVVMAVPAAYY